MTPTEQSYFRNAPGEVRPGAICRHSWYAKTKAVPASHFEDILDPGAGFAGFAVWDWDAAQQPRLHGSGDPSTLSLVPWMPGFARMVCVSVHGQPMTIPGLSCSAD